MWRSYSQPPRTNRALGRPGTWWIDLSVIAIQNRGTGIQRVVKNVLAQLHRRAPAGIAVVGIVSIEGRPYTCLDESDGTLGRQGRPARPAPGDVFIALDLAPRRVVLRQAQLMAWRRSGVRMVFVVYDLLPLRHPEWFNAISALWFRRWLKTLAATADSVLSISRVTDRDFSEWWNMSMRGAARPAQAVLPLGVSTVDPGRDNPAEPGRTLENLPPRYVLMVGTLEPRKAHAVALAAFEQLWSDGAEVALVIAGRAGWKTDLLQQRLHMHPERGLRLRWIDGPTDRQLDELYRHCDGLLMASYAEGYGLPVLEALDHGKAVLARDIPSLRELPAASGLTWFTDDRPTALAAAISCWLATSGVGPMPSLASKPSWDETGQALVDHLCRN